MSFAVVALILGAVLGFTPGAAPAQPPASAVCTPLAGYRPPVDAPVIDPFRAPPNPFGPGNRGLDYGTPPATPVGAIGPGLVVFAGQVGGRLYVTVQHADGLRSSYAFLAALTVSAGARVARGDVVGRAGPSLHLGVRCGGAYLDPATLFPTLRRVRLVPDRWYAAPLGRGRTPASPAPVVRS
jgi:murein DD-endopeptidase MepM/ murein hydrolase activator NlpD